MFSLNSQYVSSHFSSDHHANHRGALVFSHLKTLLIDFLTLKTGPYFFRCTENGLQDMYAPGRSRYTRE